MDRHRDVGLMLISSRAIRDSPATGASGASHEVCFPSALTGDAALLEAASFKRSRFDVGHTNRISPDLGHVLRPCGLPLGTVQGRPSRLIPSVPPGTGHASPHLTRAMFRYPRIGLRVTWPRLTAVAALLGFSPSQLSSCRVGPGLLPRSPTCRSAEAAPRLIFVEGCAARIDRAFCPQFFAGSKPLS